MKLTVYDTPKSVLEKDFKEQVVVVIDVLRGTSTIITALYNGCREVIPAIEIEDVINLSRNYEKDSFLLCGERNTLAIEGFHLSNSPLEFTREAVEGKTLIMTTTNGSNAIRRSFEAKEVVICSMINADATTEHLLKLGEDIIFICAGTDGKFSLDDIITAGAIISRIKDSSDDSTSIELSDLAIVAADMYEGCRDNPHALLKDTAHYKRMIELGLHEDIDYCLSLNAAPVVAIYQDGVIKKM